ncbi:MAG TPA: diacylglycerol kinase [Planctomycetaceae bacterium]|nr:diacylglycerol kinase [Planctomycetaceae bacterium]
MAARGVDDGGSLDRGPRRPRGWIGKFADAFRGVAVAVRGHVSFAAHLPAAAAAVALGACLGLDAGEWCLVALAIGGVLGAEAFNTAIEELAKAVGTYPDDGIRDALDVASGGVLVAVTAAVVVGLVLFVPKLLALAGWS